MADRKMLDALVPVDEILARIESVHCAHWEQQRILVVFSDSRVAKLCPADDDRLLWERKFVSRVLNWLLDQNVTPCVTRHYGCVECLPKGAFGRVLWRKTERALQQLKHKETGSSTPFTSALSCISPSQTASSARSILSPFANTALLRLDRKNNNDNVRTNGVSRQNVDTNDTEPRLVGFVVERAPGISLHQWAQQHHSLHQWICVLFQLLYTIDTMRALGIRHNDMHWDNVFVDPRGWNETFFFVLPTNNGDNARFTVCQGQPAVRLIDFDKASVVDPPTNRKAPVQRGLPIEWYDALAHNPILNGSMCTSYGMCNNEANDKYDAHTVLCYLMRGIEQYKYRIPQPLRDWLNQQAMQSGERLYSADFENGGGFLCRLGKPFCGTGRSYSPSDDEQRPTLSMLTESDLFAPLSADLSMQAPSTAEKKVFVHPECNLLQIHK